MRFEGEESVLLRGAFATVEAVGTNDECGCGSTRGSGSAGGCGGCSFSSDGRRFVEEGEVVCPGSDGACVVLLTMLDLFVGTGHLAVGGKPGGVYCVAASAEDEIDGLEEEEGTTAVAMAFVRRPEVSTEDEIGGLEDEEGGGREGEGRLRPLKELRELVAWKEDFGDRLGEGEVSVVMVFVQRATGILNQRRSRSMA